MDNNPALSRVRTLFEAVRLKPSAVGLACAAVCLGALAQSESPYTQGTQGTPGADHYGTTARDTPGSTRLYNLPLASELPADPSYCATTEAQAVAYANGTWSGVGQRPPIEVYECRRERIVQSVVPGEQLRDVVLGNIFIVQANGSVNYRSRGVGTFEKTTTAAASSYAPAPAPAPTVSGTAWFTTPTFAPGAALDLHWAGVNAVSANIVSCSGNYFWLPSNGRPATGNVNIGAVYDASFVCTVDFVSATGETARANAWGSSDSSLPPAPAPAVAVAPPPSGSPPPASAPICVPPNVVNVISGACETPFGTPVPPPPPPPAAAACPSTAAMVPYAYYAITGYSTHWSNFGDPIYTAVYSTTSVGTLPAANLGESMTINHSTPPHLGGACFPGYATFACGGSAWSLAYNNVPCEGQAP